MNIRSLGRERQQGLHGMVVNVSIDIYKTVNQLPREVLKAHVLCTFQYMDDLGHSYSHKPFSYSCFGNNRFRNLIYTKR